MGIIWGISVHIKHKGELLFCIVCIFEIAIKNVEVKIDVQREP